MADPIAVLIAAREGEPSLLDGADLPTGGNPLAMLELASDADDESLGLPGTPAPVSTSVAGSFLRRIGNLDAEATRACARSGERQR